MLNPVCTGPVQARDGLSAPPGDAGAGSGRPTVCGRRFGVGKRLSPSSTGRRPHTIPDSRPSADILQEPLPPSMWHRAPSPSPPRAVSPPLLRPGMPPPEYHPAPPAGQPWGDPQAQMLHEADRHEAQSFALNNLYSTVDQVTPFPRDPTVPHADSPTPGAGRWSTGQACSPHPRPRWTTSLPRWPRSMVASMAHEGSPSRRPITSAQHNHTIPGHWLGVPDPWPLLPDPWPLVGCPRQMMAGETRPSGIPLDSPRGPGTLPGICRRLC